jgi:hypothetical protein
MIAIVKRGLYESRGKYFINKYVLKFALCGKTIDPQLLPLKDGRGKHGIGRATSERRDAVRDALVGVIHLPPTVAIRGTYRSPCSVRYMTHEHASSF